MILTLPSEQERCAMIERCNNASAQFGVSKDRVRVHAKYCLSPQQLQQLRHENAHFLHSIAQQLLILHELLIESCYAMCIATHEGYILEVHGHERMLDYYATRNCIPGYRWTLETAGTSSMTMALSEQRPVVLASTDTWANASRDYVNAASPVFNHQNKLIGVISMTGLKETMQSHTIGLLVQAAANVQLQFFEARKTEEALVHNHFLDSLIEMDGRGVVALDTNGCIMRMNKNARSMLGLSDTQEQEVLVGEKNIDQLLHSKFKISPFVTSGAAFTERETLCMIHGVSSRYVLSLTPIGSSQDNAFGALLHMTERQQMINIVNAVSGLRPTYTFDSLVGESRSFLDAVNLAKIVAQSDAPVLIQGETGTGKELFAQSIHNASSRSKGVFMVINCGAIPRDLLESELFGYEEGAFTGAQKGGRPGKLELSHGGTLFLDEIGDMPFDMQVKLLRVLNSGEIQRIGGRKNIVLNLRIITATHIDLHAKVLNKTFREDLFYRINTFHIHVPPLCQREGDVLRLAQFFLQKLQQYTDGEEKTFSPQTIAFMEQYAWPGNVREMQSAMERGLRLCSGKLIEPDHLFANVQHEVPRVSAVPPRNTVTVPMSRKERELADIMYYMNLYDNNISKVARSLQMSRVTLYRKLKEYNGMV